MASHTIAFPTAFLSLAPTTSASYPTQKAAPAPASPETKAATKAQEVPVPAAVAAPVENETEAIVRRASNTSTGSDGSVRFLKLGPVHWGEGDGKGDWSENSIAE